LIEGGANLAGSALSAGIVDRIAFFVAPKILGAGLSAIEGMKSRTVSDAVLLEDLSARPFGEDWLIEARVPHDRKEILTQSSTDKRIR
jgi:diaminohydroxyphosphoribosylaminopyrimidine deaminase/5-amino-6-(5-phosphoribosylamino)uracil reductase